MACRCESMICPFISEDTPMSCSECPYSDGEEEENE